MNQPANNQFEGFNQFNFSNSIFTSGVTGQQLQLGQKSLIETPCLWQSTTDTGPTPKRSRVFSTQQIDNDTEKQQPAKTPRRSASKKGTVETVKKTQKNQNPLRTSSAKAKGVTLKHLIDANLLIPGERKLVVNYRGQIHAATLMSDGSILFDGREFSSPSAFSVYAKRKVTPEKQGDDGWKSVQYEGSTLDSYRKKLSQMSSK
eukprot:TRINITY_DN18338_c0_g1_i1.p2 TRINITY_DN18338_c0_g1~~TRINITY_DN18338_c0_g1_i1.p2  ORF type:complete len:212 (-),score=13.44 TRINITY_DN18338_c0_g1_i1:262-873(-)